MCRRSLECLLMHVIPLIGLCPYFILDWYNSHNHIKKWRVMWTCTEGKFTHEHVKPPIIGNRCCKQKAVPVVQSDYVVEIFLFNAVAAAVYDQRILIQSVLEDKTVTKPRVKTWHRNIWLGADRTIDCFVVVISKSYESNGELHDRWWTCVSV